MRTMPAFIHFWGLTPDEFRDLPLTDYLAMLEYQNRLSRRPQWDADEAWDTIRRLNG